MNNNKSKQLPKEVFEMSAYNIIKAKEKGEGQGAKVKRVFPTQHYPGHHDPFVLLDEFFVESPAGFPNHEHRGFEAITYMLEGSFLHEDNLGNSSEVQEGGVQAFNAGKSLVHSEKPGETGYSHGIQLWVNLPREKKKSDPKYQQLKETKLIKDKNEIKVRKILGEDVPINLNTEVEYFDVKLKEDVPYQMQIKKGHKGLIYVINGSLSIDNLKVEISEGEALLFDNLDKVKITSISDTRFIILSGLPLDQKIEIRGSFVE